MSGAATPRARSSAAEPRGTVAARRARPRPSDARAGVVEVAARGEVGDDLGGDLGRGAAAAQPRASSRRSRRGARRSAAASRAVRASRIARATEAGSWAPCRRVTAEAVPPWRAVMRYFSDAGARSPSVSRILASRSARTAGFSCSHFLAFSRPWPMRSFL